MTRSLTAALVACCLGVALGAAQQEAPPTKKGETRLVVTGCLSGRVLTATRNPNERAEVVTGPDVVGRSFRVSGPKDVTTALKKYNRGLVEVTGTIKTSDLAEAPGFNMGRTRVTVGLSPGTDPSRPGSAATTPVTNYVVLDATLVRLLSSDCPIR